MKKTWRGPDGGYDFPEKKIYRRQVSKALLEGRHDKPSMQCLILPGPLGLEIGILEQHGIRRRNIHCVDEKPARVAWIQRRFPGVRTYGCDLGDAAKQMCEEGVRIGAANLDLCGPIRENLHDLLCGISRARLWSDDARVAVTVLRGREKRDYVGAWMRMASEVGWETDEFRAAILGLALSGFHGLQDQPPDPTPNGLLAFPYLPKQIRRESYRSTAGNQTMLWAAFDLVSGAAMHARCEELTKALAAAKSAARVSAIQRQFKTLTGRMDYLAALQSKLGHWAEAS